MCPLFRKYFVTLSILCKFPILVLRVTFKNMQIIERILKYLGFASDLSKYAKYFKEFQNILDLRVTFLNMQNILKNFKIFGICE